MKTLIKNILQLIRISVSGGKVKKGIDMRNVHVVENAYVIIEDDKIHSTGTMKELNEEAGMRNAELKIIDATNRIVLPGFVDSHTHIVFAKTREEEFVMRLKGMTYEEIAKQGGGILNSAKVLRETSFKELLASAEKRIREVIRTGTTAIEIKSGYGLSVESELKMLRVIQTLKKKVPIPIRATFLGAHAIPEEYKNNRKGYINLICKEMLPKIAEEKLADYVDVFCDKGFFTVEETDTILSSAEKFNLIPKIHANELDYSGGIQVGVKHKALSVDHLEYTGDEEISALKNSDTMPVLLPSTAFFLNLPYAPARKMIDAGLPIALASDYNPGSSPSGNMQFVLSLACINMKTLPEEAITASTLNSAYALGWSNEMGSVEAGKKANLIITKEIPSYNYLPYSLGEKWIDKVIINGNVWD